ncbi:uncharacterized protein LOC119554282 [Drosophila subpulchrella]|uniref:uncharacterized protein LOC119554282 n=1 Tax=Drosophila subpulchrella TaxID=1486046 RepID=UPI0018A1696A|nr:uncharacterized protein LOC119554282 [Drosophila subpulchrella]XP_037721065.1 uncharacterized protein LOC119554282 [Drosophila subpulchrella]XP_037721066.1 uncharacterized protein LOC119554282 [Drosophila subpulchrella]
MGARSIETRTWKIQLLILLSGVLLTVRAAAAEATEDVTHPPPDHLQTESRSRKNTVLVVDEDLDGRNAYINNKFVPSEPAEVLDEEQNAPLYEILQKQMEQVLASSAPNDPVYEQRENQKRRDQQPPHQPPYFSGEDRDGDLQDDYEDDEDQTDQGYALDPEKPDAVASSPEEEDQNEASYQAPSLPSSTTRRPHRRRSTSTTAQPRTTRTRSTAQPRITARPSNQTSTTEPPPHASTTSHRPIIGSSSHSKANPHPGNSLASDPQVYQHKRRIVFKTISTGSQFVNSPIGDLMIKFSIGFAKPAAPGESVSSSRSPSSSNDAVLRALSQNFIRNLELQKLKRSNKVQKD